MGSLKEMLTGLRGSQRKLLPGLKPSEELRLVPMSLGHALTGLRALESLQSHRPSMDLFWVFIFQPEHRPCAQPGSGCWGGAEDARADSSFVMCAFGKQNVPLCLCSHSLSDTRHQLRGVGWLGDDRSWVLILKAGAAFASRAADPEQGADSCPGNSPGFQGVSWVLQLFTAEYTVSKPLSWSRSFRDAVC